MGSLYSEVYDPNWGDSKIGKLWINAKDLLENGRRPLLPSPSFYEASEDSEKDLALMAGRIIKYLKFKNPYTLRVAFSNNLESPGNFILRNMNAKITINSKYSNNSKVCAAILAHEICHLVLVTRNLTEENEFENERLTDFSSVYFGLGLLILNGKQVIHKTDTASLIASIAGFLSLIFLGAGFLSKPASTTIETSFGYWRVEEYKRIFHEYLQKNNIYRRDISVYLTTNGNRLQLEKSTKFTNSLTKIIVIIFIILFVVLALMFLLIFFTV